VAPNSPVKHLVATSNGETEGTIRAFLNRARAMELLTGNEPGKPGGELTAKARKILKGQR
jgi:predicted transcriptional regulator